MRKETKKAITDSMVRLLTAKNGYLQTEAARVLCAIDNVYVSEGNTAQQASGKVTAALGLARQQLADRLAKKKAKKKLANRKYYIRKKLQAIENQENK